MRVWSRWQLGLGRRRRRPGPPQVGVAASDLMGTTPDGTAVQLAMEGRWAVVLFLTTGCYGCRVLWDGVDRTHPDSVVIVTPSPTTESARQVTQLAPADVQVIMSSEAWHAYGVRSAPWCVVVAGGVVVADGPAPASWEEVPAPAGPASA